MKTPEHWRPSCAVPSLSVFFTERLSNTIMVWHHMTSWRGVASYLTLHDFLCHGREREYIVTKWIHTGPFWYTKNDVFQYGDLDLWPWTSNLAEILRSIAKPNFVTLGQTFRLWERSLTDRHTHRKTGPMLYSRPLMREGIKASTLYLPTLKTEELHIPDLIVTHLVYIASSTCTELHTTRVVLTFKVWENLLSGEFWVLSLHVTSHKPPWSRLWWVHVVT